MLTFHISEARFPLRRPASPKATTTQHKQKTNTKQTKKTYKTQHDKHKTQHTHNNNNTHKTNQTQLNHKPSTLHFKLLNR